MVTPLTPLSDSKVPSQCCKYNRWNLQGGPYQNARYSGDHIISSGSKVTPLRSLGRPTATTPRAPAPGIARASLGAGGCTAPSLAAASEASPCVGGGWIGPWTSRDHKRWEYRIPIWLMFKVGETMRKRFNLYDLKFITTSWQLGMVKLGKRSIWLP